VPDSCCKNDVAECGKGLLGMSEKAVSTFIHTDGCLTKLEDYVAAKIAVVGGVGIGIALVQV